MCIFFLHYHGGKSLRATAKDLWPKIEVVARGMKSGKIASKKRMSYRKVYFTQTDLYS
jgi:hypothetical protein